MKLLDAKSDPGCALSYFAETIFVQQPKTADVTN
jgi:hypothetical protein